MAGVKRASPRRAASAKSAKIAEGKKSIPKPEEEETNETNNKRLRKEESPDTILATPSSQPSTSAENGADDDADDVLDADFDIIAEEEKSRKEREAAEEKNRGASEDPEAAKTLESDKFHQLNNLLTQTGLYSTFLKEQMQEIEEQVGHQEMRYKKQSGIDHPASTQAFLLPLMRGGILRDYQIKGIKWMMSLWQNGLNGILADQMGLGKTVQAIGFLSHLWDKGVVGPFIVIAPLSTLSNWVSEFIRWTPNIPVLLYHGSQDERTNLRYRHLQGPGGPHFPVIVTSYEIAIRDSKHLTKFHYKYMVVDEGHRLKNFNCKLIRELRSYETANKLLLTGTPLQNNLSELWSLLNFLLPEIFASLQDFEKWFDFSKVDDEDEDAQTQHTKIVEKLHNILKPFLLRRLKADVCQSLPMKKEIILYPTMTDHQKDINQKLLDKTLWKTLKDQAKQYNSSAKVGKLRNILMQMRKNCNHPDLITGDYDGSLTLPSGETQVEQCGKMRVLDRLLTKLEKKGHKVLIFSQMTKMLDLIEVYLEDRGHTACRIDGGVNLADRRLAIDRFNRDPNYQYFLLSTRAGGLGINLASADTVIIYDSDWNPQQDLQAMDRCHRIGQTKPVLVFRLITANSVEEQMLKKAESKLKLERLVIKKGAFVDADNITKNITFSVQEMRDILKSSVGTDDKKEVKGFEISDRDLNALLNRTDLAKFKKIKAKKGKGYEVLAQQTGAGILSNVNA